MVECIGHSASQSGFMELIVPGELLVPEEQLIDQRVEVQTIETELVICTRPNSTTNLIAAISWSVGSLGLWIRVRTVFRFFITRAPVPAALATLASGDSIGGQKTPEVCKLFGITSRPTIFAAAASAAGIATA